jgi:hypothetical protein
MNPNDLRARLRQEITARLDLEAWNHCKKVEVAEKESLERYVRAWPRPRLERDVLINQTHSYTAGSGTVRLRPPRKEPSGE